MILELDGDHEGDRDQDLVEFDAAVARWSAERWTVLMQRNRTMPDDVLVPVLAYPSVSEAVEWLTRAFGFTFRWQIEDHRAQLGLGEHAAMAITAGSPPTDGGDHVLVRVDDVDAHRARAAAAGAVVGVAEDHFYGERQYTAVDFAGWSWVFSESIADLDPTDWGARTA
jgi:uncharacterized glyoxalase superfamily protein PhnB